MRSRSRRRHRNPSGRPYTAEELAFIYQSAPEDLRPYLLDPNFPNNLEWDAVEQPRLSPEEIKAISDPRKRKKARKRIVAAETEHNQAQDTLLWEIEEFRKSDEFLKGFVLFQGMDVIYGRPRLVYDSRFDADHWGELWSESDLHDTQHIGFYDKEFARAISHAHMSQIPLQSYSYIDEPDRDLQRWYDERDATRAKIDKDATRLRAATALRYDLSHAAFHREVIDGLMSGKVDPTVVWIMASRYTDATDIQEKNLAVWSVDLLRSREFGRMFPDIPDVPLKKTHDADDKRKGGRRNAFLIATKKLHNEQLVWYALDFLLENYRHSRSHSQPLLDTASRLLAYVRSDGAGDMTVAPNLNSDMALFGKAVVDGYREAGWFEDFASLNTAMEHVAQTLVPPYASRVFTGDIVGNLTKDPSFVFKHLVRTVTDPLNQVKIPESINRRANQILVDQGLI